MRQFTARLLVLIAIATVAGCRSEVSPQSPAPASSPLMTESPTQPPTTVPARPYTIAGQTAGAPTGCEPDVIAARADSLFQAIAARSPTAIDDYFGRARQAPFQWYSIGQLADGAAEPAHFVAHNLTDLALYLSNPPQHHTNLRLESITFNGWDSARGLVHFGPIVLTQSIDDPAGAHSRKVTGKGAYHCATESFIVLSLAIESKGQ